MIIDDRKLLGLKVVTRSGRVVGQIKRLQINTESHMVEKYIVRPGLLPNMFSDELLISPSQVLGITETQMTVIDGGEVSATGMVSVVD